MPQRLIIVAGPTASGKSAFALELARRVNGTVINADSMQIYRDLHILTARPGEGEAHGIPHSLYGILDAADLCSAARWADLAHDAIDAAFAQGRMPIVTGGTGLYLKTLLYGIAAVPEIDEASRAEARALHRQMGGLAFHALLARRDPVTAARLHPSDSQRLMRAYEVVRATGKPLSAWQQANSTAPAYDAEILLLMPPRAELFQRCDQRFQAMIDQGALEEVRRLAGRDLPPHLPIMKALGVPPLIEHLKGRLTLAAAIAAGQLATRHYAKRQVTWFRHQLPAARIVDAQLYFKTIE